MSTFAPPAPDTRVGLPAPATWSWRITWGGRSWTDLDVTAQHVAVLTVLNGRDDWLNLQIEQAVNEARQDATAGPQRLINMINALVSVDRSPEGTSEERAKQILLDVIAETRQATFVEILDAVELRR